MTTSWSTEVADAIVEAGQMITLRRISPHGIRLDVQVMAVVRQFQPDDLAGDIMQGDRRVIISNREIAARQWPGPPVAGDQVIIAGRTATLTINPETIYLDGEVVKHTMMVRG